MEDKEGTWAESPKILRQRDCGDAAADAADAEDALEMIRLRSKERRMNFRSLKLILGGF